MANVALDPIVGRRVAAAAVAGLLLGAPAWAVASPASVRAAAAVPGMRLPPDEPPSPAAPPHPPAAPAHAKAPPAARPQPPRPWRVQPAAAPAPAATTTASAPPPAPEPVPPVTGATPAPAPASTVLPALWPPRGGAPAGSARRARELEALEPRTATDVPSVVPWAVIPGLAVALAFVLVGLGWLVLGWPSRLLGTARVAMAGAVPVPPPAAPPAVPVQATAMTAVAPGPEATLSEAARRLPPAVQRDLVELAALLEEADIGLTGGS